MEITIHTASIEHRHGSNTYAALSERELNKEIDAYVQEWWRDEMHGHAMPRSMKKRIERYFDGDGAREEYLTTDKHFIKLPQPFASAPAMLKALKKIARRKPGPESNIARKTLELSNL